MIRNTATAEDFARWTAHAKTCNDEQLKYIIQDCRDAEQAMKEWNPERESYYADQGFTYVDEARRRHFAKRMKEMRA